MGIANVAATRRAAAEDPDPKTQQCIMFGREETTHLLFFYLMGLFWVARELHD